MDLLHGAVRPYAWGSRTVLAELLGRPVPAPHPEAELWLGANPGDPSTVGGRSLLDVVAEDASTQLGPAAAARWGSKLPFLLKVLAVHEPLSLQAHPSTEQSREGYEREEALGIPRDAPTRNYPDPTAKPELLCALSEFDALAGFRDPARTVELLRALGSEVLQPYTELLAAQPDHNGLRALFTTWVTLPSSALDPLLTAVIEACVEHVSARGEFDPVCRTVLELAEDYPGDVGVLAALLLNRMVLQPGEAIHLPAGNVHAYLHGTAIEILANSDNVLRCGLTPKHVDVPELLRVLDFGSGDMPVLHGDPLSPNLTVYRTNVAEFELSKIEFHGAATDEVSLDSGAQIMICVDGGVIATADSGCELELGRGKSAWVAAADGTIRLRPAPGSTHAMVFRATAGLHSPIDAPSKEHVNVR